MGRMVDGRWQAEDRVGAGEDGHFRRAETTFRDRIAPGGRFPPAAGRYLLYVSWACPWAHRTLVFRRLKGLEAMIDVAATHWLMGDDGWTFEPGEGVIPDKLFGARTLSEIYARADPRYTGRVTVPVLWDRQENTIVNNESADIIRMFNDAFDGIGATPGDYYPEALRAEIDALNDRIYDTVNNGVYKAGFATTQAAYEAAVHPLFGTLDRLETCLAAGGPWLLGDTQTEADWRLFTTLVRFDPVYVGHFKCNLRRLIDYPALSAYLRRLLDVPGIRDTVNLAHIKRHYYQSHRAINPTGIVPLGPAVAA